MTYIFFFSTRKSIFFIITKEKLQLTFLNVKVHAKRFIYVTKRNIRYYEEKRKRSEYSYHISISIAESLDPFHAENPKNLLTAKAQ